MMVHPFIRKKVDGRIVDQMVFPQVSLIANSNGKKVAFFLV